MTPLQTNGNLEKVIEGLDEIKKWEFLSTLAKIIRSAMKNGSYTALETENKDWGVRLDMLSAGFDYALLTSGMNPEKIMTAYKNFQEMYNTLGTELCEKLKRKNPYLELLPFERIPLLQQVRETMSIPKQNGHYKQVPGSSA